MKGVGWEVANRSTKIHSVMPTTANNEPTEEDNKEASSESVKKEQVNEYTDKLERRNKKTQRKY